ncbi:zinc finger protein 593-like [Elysia marginata]|uniref:Zinc finger protein 593-like n=1 Tax=Elysia marginata TaxID=1093978 RepID=A0AAV4F8W8_9GAST|nr:zinc finger protein 593-like [Elysia marginata]
MGRYRLKKMHKGDKPLKEKYRTKRRTRDLDLIHSDMKSPASLLNQEVDLDKPGAAQHYCLTCAKYYIDQKALSDHFKSKPHKRRLKALEVEPYTHEEADRAAGMGSYIAPKKVLVLAQQKLGVEDKEGDTTMKPA